VRSCWTAAGGLPMAVRKWLGRKEKGRNEFAAAQNQHLARLFAAILLSGFVCHVPARILWLGRLHQS
jgi:hypothetical protein